MVIPAGRLHEIAEELRDLQTIQSVAGRLAYGSGGECRCVGDEPGFFERQYASIAEKLLTESTGASAKMKVMVTLEGRLATFVLKHSTSSVDVAGPLMYIQCPNHAEVASLLCEWAHGSKSGETMSHVNGLVAICYRDES